MDERLMEEKAKETRLSASLRGRKSPSFPVRLDVINYEDNNSDAREDEDFDGDRDVFEDDIRFNFKKDDGKSEDGSDGDQEFIQEEEYGELHGDQAGHPGEKVMLTKTGGNNKERKRIPDGKLTKKFHLTS